jgi:hypothetical protein
MFANLPSSATFQHSGARNGFEVVCFRHAQPTGDGYLLEGGTTAIEDGVPWSVHYRVAVDQSWQTTHAEAVGISSSGHHTLRAERRDGLWRINDVERPDLEGCVDIDFESSLVTNTLAVHRLDLSATVPQQVPAAFVRADDLRVERVEQSYRCLDRTEDQVTFDYTSSTFDFASRLVFDGSGVVIDYPGIGRRHG